MAKQYSASEVVQMLECESDDEFDGYIDENYDSDENEVEFEVTDIDNGIEIDELCEEIEYTTTTVCLDSSSNVSLDAIESSISSCPEYGSSGSSAYLSPEYSTSNSSPSSPGCTVDMSGKDPVKFLQLFLTDNLLKRIVEETNRYANDFIESNELPPHTRRVRRWKPCSLDEMKNFLAITVGMTVDGKTRIEDYWSKSWPFATKAFSSIMSQNRFQLVLRFLHRNDSKFCRKRGQQGYDPLYKIRPLMDGLLDRFKNCYRLHKEVSVDESMISFKGRIWFIQYMPKKPPLNRE